MRRNEILFRVGVGVIAALVITLVILVKVQSGYYLLTPDIAHPVAPLVNVAGSKPATGGGNLYFVDVQEQPASEFDVLFQWLHPHSTKIPAVDLIPPGSNNKAYIAGELRQMALSQRVAAAVALRYLGYPVDIHPNGVVIEQLFTGTDAIGKLQPNDVIVDLNGQPTPTQESLHNLMTNVTPGDTVTLRVYDGHVTRAVQIHTGGVPDENGKRRAFIGIAVETNYFIGKLPIKVKIDAQGIGGPSAGLPFALEVLRRLGYNVTHGYRVAATGEIHADGTVSAIGGVEQKTWGAREAGAQVFLVPVDGKNALVAKHFAGPNLRIIPVTSLKQALAALAALPKLHQK